MESMVWQGLVAEVHARFPQASQEGRLTVETGQCSLPVSHFSEFLPRRWVGVLIPVLGEYRKALF